MVPQNKSFSEALAAVKQGKLISREGWNGKGMFVFINYGSCDFEAIKGVPSPQSVTHIEGIRRELFSLGDVGTVTRLPNLNLKGVTGSTATWVPSITDVMSEDWCIFERDPDGNIYVHNEEQAETAKAPDAT